MSNAAQRPPNHRQLDERESAQSPPPTPPPPDTLQLPPGATTKTIMMPVMVVTHPDGQVSYQLPGMHAPHPMVQLPPPAATPKIESPSPELQSSEKRKRESGAEENKQATPKDSPKRPAPQLAKVGGDTNTVVPPINVLIVEDNPINLTILSTFMRRKKIKYDVARNGKEAVAKWRAGVFHFILMDIHMPVMNGIDATTEIRRLEKTHGSVDPGIPNFDLNQRTSSNVSSASSNSPTTPHRSSVVIVALTASSQESDRVAALAAGCNDFLTKPVSHRWLNNKIIEWGSIKALEMWADLPDVEKDISRAQLKRAQNVAHDLHVPEGRALANDDARRRLDDAERPVVEVPKSLKVPPSSSTVALPLANLARRPTSRTPPRRPNVMLDFLGGGLSPKDASDNKTMPVMLVEEDTSEWATAYAPPKGETVEGAESGPVDVRAGLARGVLTKVTETNTGKPNGKVFHCPSAFNICLRIHTIVLLSVFLNASLLIRLYTSGIHKSV